MTKEPVNLAERRARLLQAGAKVGRYITSILDPDRLLQETVDVICEEFGFYYAGVFLIDETGQWAILRAGRGEAGQAMIRAGHKLKVDGHSMIGQATGRRKALIALDVGEEPVHFKNPYLPNTRSEMALPLIVGDKLIGALTVQSEEEAAFTDDDIAQLQMMADQLAIAIHNANLHRENQKLLARAERRSRLLATAAEVGRSVTSILDMDELFRKMVDIICDVYGFYYAGVFLVDESGEWAVLRAGRGEAGAKMVAAGHKLSVGGHSMIGTAIAQRKARIALDVGEEPVHFKNPYLPHTRSEMALPLIIGDRCIGAVTVQSVEEAAFSEDDITSLQAMADQLAVAINNARLLKELEAAHAELLRTKTFEALATATLEAIHWIGNKAFPIVNSISRLREDLQALAGADEELRESVLEDLDVIGNSAHLILEVQEHLIGPALEQLPGPVLVADVLHDVVTTLEVPASTLTLEVAPALPYIRADATQLHRAFTYVIKNALEAVAGRAAPHIGISVAPSGDGKYVAVRISDNGPGIPESELDKIWAAFHSTKGASHAGLGLSATVRILNQMEGKITAFNNPEGGATFELLLPVYDAPIPEAHLPAGKIILLIDDDDPWSAMVTAAFQEAGSRVSRVPDERAQPEVFDLIFVDATLAQADATRVLRKLAKAGAAGKTVVVSSTLRVERTMELMHHGVRDVVLKPYTPAALEDLIKTLA